jgi:7-cyano-7-deazaguanine synthase in queuosine biosynthesis
MKMNNKSPKHITVNCGGLCKSNKCNSKELNIHNRKIKNLEANITISLNKFVKNYEDLPNNIIDLLHIASYMFCADRLVSRGENDSVMNNSWAREFQFNIPVLDLKFWNNKELQQKLIESLIFMTGDRQFLFNFIQADAKYFKPPAPYFKSLFDDDIVEINSPEKFNIMLFSGGLDSLAGAVEFLNSSPDSKLLLVNHNSHSSVKQIQSALSKYLSDNFQNRIINYSFKCHLTKIQSREETQRTRMFLYSSIAFAISNFFNQDSFYVFENGITSINLPLQPDLINSRASRTTHPKTLGLLNEFFNCFNKKFKILAPFYNKTKEDIFKIIDEHDQKKLISSTISCSSTRISHTSKHCGCCSQCIDRHFAAYASLLQDSDVQYDHDFIYMNCSNKTKMQLLNILRLACADKFQSLNEFFQNFPSEIADVIEYWPCDDASESFQEIYNLFSRYSVSILKAAKLMQDNHELLYLKQPKYSLLAIISRKEFLGCFKYNNS